MTLTRISHTTESDGDMKAEALLAHARAKHLNEVSGTISFFQRPPFHLLIYRTHRFGSQITT